MYPREPRWKEVQEARAEAGKRGSFKKFLMTRFGKKLYLRDEKHEGWSDYLPFYLFWCDACGHWSKDYPHGLRQYLLCSCCWERYSFVPFSQGIKEFVHTLKFFCFCIALKIRGKI